MNLVNTKQEEQVEVEHLLAGRGPTPLGGPAPDSRLVTPTIDKCAAQVQY